METDEYRLGIDFGTSSTVAVLAGPDGRIRPLLFDASPLLASAVFAGPGGDLLTGGDAERAAMAYPAGLETNPKRRIDDGTIWLGEGEHPVVDLVAAVLGRVADEARRVAGQPPVQVVLTHPAGWARPRLAILAAAAGQAGLGEVGFVAEPVAAAAYFVTVLGRDLPVGRCLVVYDLGAGTCDVAVVRRGEVGFEVVAADGLADVGGLDLDAAVVGHARTLTAGAGEAWGRLDWPQTPEDLQAWRALWRGARAAKEQLSRHPSADLHVPLVNTGLHLTRDELEKAARPLLERTVELAVATLREAATPREQIAGVFLVGGSSRIPLAATLLHRTLRIAPTTLDHPELVVAEGSLHIPARPVAAPAPPPPVTTRTPTGPVNTAPARDAASPLAQTTADPPPTDESVGPENADSRRRLYARRAKQIAAIVAVLVLTVAVTAAWRANDTATLTGHTDAVLSVAFSPDGKTLATTSHDFTARLWNVATGQTTTTLTGHTSHVNGVAFSPDGKTLATTSSDYTARLWNVATGQTTTTLIGHTTYLVGVAFSPDGKTLATTSWDKTARLWNVATGQTTTTLTGHTNVVYAVAFSPDGKTLATTSSDYTARLWNVATGQTTATLTGHTSYVVGVAFSPDGKTLATTSWDKTVRLWNVATGQTTATLTGHTNWVNSVAFSPDGTTLATASRDYTARLWNVATGQTTATLTGHTDEVRAVAFSPDGTTLATASLDKTVRLWNVAS